MADDVEQDGFKTVHHFPPITPQAAPVALDLVALAIDMRAKQKAYFRSRTNHHLISAKAAEAAFDKAVAEACK